MERLTEKSSKPSVNSQYVKKKGFYTADCIERLGVYEDTGLTPDQIAGLKDRDTEYFCKTSIFDHESVVCKCGNDIEKDSGFKFCPYCGNRIKLEE